MLPGDPLLLVNFDPADLTRLAAFRARFGVPALVPVLGPLSGKLDNSAARLGLYKPDVPEAALVPYVLVDEVEYSDAPPWPASADGSGASLQRRSLAQFGNDALNWAAAAPTPGWTFSGGATPLITLQPADLETQASLTALASSMARRFAA